MAKVKQCMIQEILKEIDHLSTLPQVVTKILAMTESSNVSAVGLSKEMDQSLSTKVLKVANSAYYGGRSTRRVSSVDHAIVVIGFDALKEIVLITSLFHTFQNTQVVKSLEPLWKHSMECALVAKRLAWVYRYEAMDEAYLVGLIHDIGKLVIQQHFPEQFQLIKSKGNGGVEDLENEKEILGMTHAEIAGKLSEHWNFSEILVEAVAHHHDEKWQLNPRLGRILFNADRFVSGEIDFDKMLESFRLAGMNYPGNWKSGELKRVEESLHEEMKKASSVLEAP